MKESEEILRAVLQSRKSFDINYPGVSPPLLEALRYRVPEMFRIILSHPDVDVNAQDLHGQTALMWGVGMAYPDLVADLLARPEINLKIEDNWGRTAVDIGRDHLLRPRSEDKERIKECIRLIEEKLGNK